MLKKVQIYKALDIEIKKQKGPIPVKEAYKGHHSLKEELSQPGMTLVGEVAGGNPLRGQVRDSYRASTHAKSLVDNGARAVSVATDRFLYYGEDKHLGEVRNVVKVPVLRRDFIFEEYQIEESKILGADAIYLLAALLEPERLVALLKLARSKGLDVVVEVASEEDLDRAVKAGADIVCVVGRDLDTWQPSWELALDLLARIPSKQCLRMVEAGIDTLEQLTHLEDLGVHGVIIGDALLDEFYPGKRLAQIRAGLESARKSARPKGKAKAAEPAIEPTPEPIPVETETAPAPAKPAKKAKPAAAPAVEVQAPKATKTSKKVSTASESAPEKPEPKTKAPKAPVEAKPEAAPKPKAAPKASAKPAPEPEPVKAPTKAPKKAAPKAEPKVEATPDKPAKKAAPKAEPKVEAAPKKVAAKAPTKEAAPKAPAPEAPAKPAKKAAPKAAEPAPEPPAKAAKKAPAPKAPAKKSSKK